MLSMQLPGGKEFNVCHFSDTFDMGGVTHRDVTDELS